MTEHTIPQLAAWESFYVIVGTSGAALIGLQFVVITLIADMRSRTSLETLGAFGTPTVVNLSGAVLVSAIMSVPWHSLLAASVALALCGVGGLVYCTVVLRRARHQTEYQPVWQDWLWFAALPASACAALTWAAFILRTTTERALYVIGAVALGLLLIGVHNAWDTVTHVLITNRKQPE